MNHETILISASLVIYGAASIVSVFSWLRSVSKGGLLVGVLMSLGLIPLLIVWLERAMAFGGCLPLDRFKSLAFYAILTTAAYWAMVRRRETRLLAGLLAPLVAIVLILGEPLFVAEPQLAGATHKVWLSAHVATALISYAMFSLATVLAAAYLVQDRNLKRKNLDDIFARLPSLETLDRFMSWQVGMAFAGLTVSMLIGVLLVRLNGGGEAWIRDPKIIATSVTWGVYAALVHLRAIMGRRGRSLALICILGSICMLFAFVGVNMVSQDVHGSVNTTQKVQP